jgi:hypothetical protein
MQGREQPLFFSVSFLLSLFFFFAKKSKQTCCNTAFCVWCVCDWGPRKPFMLLLSVSVSFSFLFKTSCHFHDIQVKVTSVISTCAGISFVLFKLQNRLAKVYFSPKKNST